MFFDILISLQSDLIFGSFLILSHTFIIKIILKKMFLKKDDKKMFYILKKAIIYYFIPWITFFLVPFIIDILFNIKLTIFSIISIFYFIRGVYFLIYVLTGKAYFNFFVLFFVFSSVYYKLISFSNNITVSKIYDYKIDFIFFSINIDSLISAILHIIIYYSFSISFYKIVDLILIKKNTNENDSILIKSSIRYILYIIGFMTLYNRFNISMQKFAIITGALSVGIGFGLQKIASNFVSGFIVAFDKQIKIGDLIQFENGMTGMVKDIRIRSTAIETFDLETVIIPNECFINEKFKNITYAAKKGRIRIYLIINHNQDIEFAINLVVESIKKNIPSDLHHEIACRVDDVLENGFRINSAFCLENLFGQEGSYLDIWNTKSKVIIDIQKSFKENNIQFAWPKISIKQIC